MRGQAFGVRASPDYVWQAGGRVLKLPTVQWAIGPDNAFHWNGLGLLPCVFCLVHTHPILGWTSSHASSLCRIRKEGTRQPMCDVMVLKFVPWGGAMLT
jgi:hypothetical protein